MGNEYVIRCYDEDDFALRRPLIDASVNLSLRFCFICFPLQVVQAFMSVGLIVQTCAMHEKIRSMEFYIRYDDSVNGTRSAHVRT